MNYIVFNINFEMTQSQIAIQKYRLTFVNIFIAIATQLSQHEKKALNLNKDYILIHFLCYIINFILLIIIYFQCTLFSFNKLK